MEHIQTLLEGIDDLKHHLTDRDYIKLMNALTKMNEIVKKNILYDDDDDQSLSSIPLSQDEWPHRQAHLLQDHLELDHFIQEDTHLPYILEQYFELRDILQFEFDNFIKQNNLPSHFSISSFNIIDYIAYNQLHHGSCNCSNLEFCTDTTLNFLKCKNILKIILNYPLLCIIYYKLRFLNYDTVIHDIHKYHLFSFDGTFKYESNFDTQIIIQHIKSSLAIINFLYEQNIKVLSILHIYYFLCNYGFKIIFDNEKFRITIYNKIKTEMLSIIGIQNTNIWAQSLHFNPNIFHNILHNIEILFPSLLIQPIGDIV